MLARFSGAMRTVLLPDCPSSGHSPLAVREYSVCLSVSLSAGRYKGSNPVFSPPGEPPVPPDNSVLEYSLYGQPQSGSV